jgi:hypothetical protein
VRDLVWQAASLRGNGDDVGLMDHLPNKGHLASEVYLDNLPTLFSIHFLQNIRVLVPAGVGDRLNPATTPTLGNWVITLLTHVHDATSRVLVPTGVGSP